MRKTLFTASIGLLAICGLTPTADAQWRGGMGWGNYVPNIGVGPGGIRIQQGYNRGYYNNPGYNSWRNPRVYRNDDTFYPPGFQVDTNRSYYYEPSYSSTPEAPRAMTVPNSAQVRVLLPSPDADVWLSGRKSQMMGPERVFQSPQLETGKDYVYKVRVVWHDGDKFHTEERMVDVSANKVAIVDFNKPATDRNRSEMEAEYPNNENKNPADPQRPGSTDIRERNERAQPATEGAPGDPSNRSDAIAPESDEFRPGQSPSDQLPKTEQPPAPEPAGSEDQTPGTPSDNNAPSGSNNP